MLVVARRYTAVMLQSLYTSEQSRQGTGPWACSRRRTRKQNTGASRQMSGGGSGGAAASLRSAARRQCQAHLRAPR